MQKFIYKDVIYLVLEELKQTTDDIPFEEDLIANLLNISRAVIIKQRFGSHKVEIPKEIIQSVPFKIIFKDNIYQSNREFVIINLNGAHLFYNISIPMLSNLEITYTTLDRFKYVQISKWFKKIAYSAFSNNNKLYFKFPEGTITPALLSKGITGYFNTILDDPRTIFPYEEDYLNLDFAINGDLLRPILDLTLSDLYKHIHLPEDIINNGKNDLITGINNGQQSR